jgi:hypothetical protein
MQVTIGEELHVTHPHASVGVRAPEVGVIKREKHHTTKTLTAGVRQEQ